MADNSYMTRGVGREGVAPLKDRNAPENMYMEGLRDLLGSSPVGLPDPQVGRIDKRTDPNIGDPSFIDSGQLETRRYLNQSTLNRLGRSLVNFGVLTGTTFVDSLVGSVMQAISGSYDNAVSRKLDEWTDMSRERRPIHRPEWYDEMSVGRRLLDSIFWAEQIENMGFTSGMMASSALLAATGLPTTPAVILGGIISAMSEAGVEARDVKDRLVQERTGALTSEYYKRLQNVSTPEDRAALEDWYLSGIEEIRRDGNTSGNFVYGANAALLTASNIIGWGPILKRGAQASKGIVSKTSKISGAKAVGKDGKKLVSTPQNLSDVQFRTRGKAASIFGEAGKTIGSASMESLEEVSQGIFQDYAVRTPEVATFSALEDDIQGREELDESVNLFTDVLRDAFRDKDTAMEALSGAFTSLIGVPGLRFKGSVLKPRLSWDGQMQEFYRNVKEINRQKKIVDAVNANLSSGKYDKIISNLVRTKALNRRKTTAAENGDDFNFKNYDLAELISTVSTFDDLGQLDMLKNYASGLSEASDEELVNLAEALKNDEGVNTFINTDGSVNADEVRKKVKENSDTLLNLIDEYSKLKQTLEANAPGLSDESVKSYIYGVSQINDWLSRKGVILKELYDLYKSKRSKMTLVHGEDGSTTPRLDLGVTMDEEEFMNNLRSNRKFRESFFQMLDADPSIDNATYDSLADKVDDLDRIDDSIDKFSKELDKLWNSSIEYSDTLAADKAEEKEKNRVRKLIEEIGPIEQDIVNNEFPVSRFMQYTDTYDPRYRILPDAAAAIISHLESFGKGTKEYAIAQDLKNIYKEKWKHVDVLDSAGISTDKIDKIITLASSHDSATLEDFKTALNNATETVLSKAEYDKFVEATKKKKTAEAALGKKKKKKSGSILDELDEEEEGTSEGSSEEDSDDEDVSEYDSMTLKEMYDEIEADPDKQAAIPDWEALDEDLMRAALKKYANGEISKDNPYDPESEEITGSDDADEDSADDEEDTKDSSEEDSEEGSEEEEKPKKKRRTRKSKEENEDSEEDTKERKKVKAPKEILGAGQKGSGITKKQREAAGEQESTSNEDAFAVGRLGMLYDLNELKNNHRLVPVGVSGTEINEDWVKSHIIPFEGLTTKKPYDLVFGGGRYFVVINIGGINVPFYMSSGLGGKKKVASRKWYPFFGVSEGKEMWLNKTTEEEINNFYGIPELKEIAEVLNKMFPSSEYSFNKDSMGVSSSGTKGEKTQQFNLVDFEGNVNKSLTPTENHRRDTDERVRENVKKVEEAVKKTLRTGSETDNFGVHIMKGAGLEEFLREGHFYNWVKERRRKKLPLTVGYVMFRDFSDEYRFSSNRTLFACIEDPNGHTVVYDSAGKEHKVQLLGVVSATSNKEVQETFSEFKKAASEESMSRRTPTGKAGTANLLSMTSKLEFAFSGRFVRENGEHSEGDKSLLSIMPKKEDGKADTTNTQLVIYTYGGKIEIGDRLDGDEVPLNTFNPSSRVGIIWLKVREGNGQITHKYVKLKRFSSKDFPLAGHTSSPIYRKIKSIVNDLTAHSNDLSVVKKRLNQLHQYLQIPDDKKIVVIPKTGEVRIGDKSGSVSDLLDMIYEEGYRFNIGRNELTYQQIIDSDILVTDLAEVFNRGASFLISQTVVEDDGSFSNRESKVAGAINVHTGRREFVEGKNYTYANIDGKEYQKTDDGRYYSVSKGRRREISDPTEQALIDLYINATTGRTRTDKFWKSSKNPLFTISDPKGYRTLMVALVIEGSDKVLHILTEEEVIEHMKTVSGRRKKEGKSGKSETVKYRIGRKYVPAVRFGKTLHRQKTHAYVSLSKDGSWKVSKEKPESSNILLRIVVPAEGQEVYRLVPDYSAPGVLLELFKGTSSLTKLFNIVGTSEKGKIPRITSVAEVEPFEIDGVQNWRTINKGTIEWVEVEELDNTLEQRGDSGERRKRRRRSEEPSTKNSELPEESGTPSVEEGGAPSVASLLGGRRKSSPPSGNTRVKAVSDAYVRRVKSERTGYGFLTDIGFTEDEVRNMKAGDVIPEIVKRSGDKSGLILDKLEEMIEKGNSIKEMNSFIVDQFSCM